MNPIVVCLCIFPTFVIFSLVSEGSETHVIMTEIKHVFVCLWDNVCVCPFLPPPQRNCASTGYKKLRQQFYDCHPVSERRTLPVDSPHVASENHYGRAKLWMAEGTKSVKCMFVKLNFHAPYSLLVSWGLKHLYMQQRDYEV